LVSEKNMGVLLAFFMSFQDAKFSKTLHLQNFRYMKGNPKQVVLKIPQPKADLYYWSE